MDGVYHGREQTKAKHFILKTYLQALAFKVLNGMNGWSALTYIDGFSGPWETRTDDHSDSSFMIAISVLKEAQEKIYELTGVRKTIRCFFSENNPSSYRELEVAVAPYHDPNNNFFITTYQGEFETALPDIEPQIENSFALFFIDPTGWTGYSLETLEPYLRGRGREVLINFMYDHINRFAASDDQKTIESLDPILGGPGWRERLDEDLPAGLAVEKLFRENLKDKGGFEYVLSTCIDKSTMDRPHFFIAYGTKSQAGMKTFRQIEYDALKVNTKDREKAKVRKRSEKTGIDDLFSDHDGTGDTSIESMIESRKALAKEWIIGFLEDHQGDVQFEDICAEILQVFMLRETNVKDVCVSLEKDGSIEKTWKGRKPKSEDAIRHIA